MPVPAQERAPNHIGRAQPTARGAAELSPCAESGCPSSEIVGHSDIEVTVTIYAHVSLDDKPRALGKLGRVLTKTVPINNAPSSSGASLPSSTTTTARRQGLARGVCAAQIFATQMRWSGVGSNRRPSAFQAWQSPCSPTGSREQKDVRGALRVAAVADVAVRVAVDNLGFVG
ncbi:hypothetical protein DKM19_44975 [Streptosporangium sp. 'caverna']|nr:hypothetical protein DKM19_44975 [Streptosporangium sp. 'caverna']